MQYDEINSSFLYKEHFHNLHEIVYIKQGSASFTISDSQYTISGNSLIFINNFESHKSTVLQFPYKRYYMLLAQDYLQSHVCDPLLLSIIKRRPGKFIHVIKLDNTRDIIINNYFETMYNEFKKNLRYSPEIIGNTINMMLIHLFRYHNEYFPTISSNNTHQIISKVERYIEKHYTDDISLKEIAYDNNIDMYYLSRLFKKVTGYGFKSYLISQRLSRAKELLLNTSYTITDVCTRCGFNNVNHFIRIFKEKEGYSPLEYKKYMMQ